jgi:predicted aspartyl protease
MRIAFAFRLLALAGLVLLLPARGWAADCGPFKLLNQVQLQAAAEGRRELIPVTINGNTEMFIFDTGAFISSVSRDVASKLNLSVHQGNITLYDMAGRVSRDQTTVKEFAFGRAKINDTVLPVLDSPGLPTGLFGVDFLGAYDADLDFGSDVLRVFSQDHCEGGVLYWKAPVAGVVPIRIRDGKITVPVTVDGHEITAIIDTGSPQTLMNQDTARYVFNLTLGAPGTEATGDFAGEPEHKVYAHIFDSLSFGDIQVKNAHMVLVPDLMGRNGERQQQAGNRARLYSDEIKMPELIIGMNVLRKLHVYIAFGERRLYVSPASVAGAQVAPASDSK